MKSNWPYIKSYIPFLLVIIFMDIFIALLLFLADIRIFRALFVFLFLSSLIVFSLLCLYLVRKEKRKEKALFNFLSFPAKDTEYSLRMAFGTSHPLIMGILIRSIYQYEKRANDLQLQLLDYESYVEIWAHEMKLPLSLLTMVLDNQKENVDPELLFKLDYVRNQINNYLSQIMVYYRCKGDKKDYLFENIESREIVEEVLEDFQPLLEEKKILVDISKLGGCFFTDRRAFLFILSQLIDNAIKYSKDEGKIMIFSTKDKDQWKLHIKDNGQGVKACDLPYIFEKSFTGDSGDRRKKSTGIGLYLVRELCQDLKIGIDLETKWEQGFEIALSSEINNMLKGQGS